MTQPTNTYDSYDAANSINEDLHQIIFDISPTETPVLSMAAQGTATNTLHEWITDALEAVDGTNARIEGDDKSAQAVTAPSRLQNYTQISDKTLVLSDTARAVDNVGTEDELARQVAKKGQEVKRDMEAIITGNQAQVAGDATTARKLRSLEAWYIAGNSNRGTGGAAGSTTTAATDATTGDLRTLKETMVKDVLQKVWTAGGNPDKIVAGAINKQKISGFAGNANRVIQADEKKLVATIDVYNSDFGVLDIIPDRFSRARTVHILQSDMISVDFLRQMYDKPLAKTGDSEKRLVGCEYTLRMNNQGAHGVVADLLT
jgi:hypothetical protein